MDVIIAIIILTGIVVGYFAQNIAEKLRVQISLASLWAGCCFTIVSGFQISKAVGFFCVSGVLLAIALLFGYDRG